MKSGEFEAKSGHQNKKSGHQKQKSGHQNEKSGVETSQKWTPKKRGVPLTFEKYTSLISI